MRITVYYSSAHKKRGNTHVIIEAFAQGAEDAGAHVETVFLAGRDIENCRACVSCWTRTPGKCAVKDDMAPLLEDFVRSDIAVLATPVYVHHVNGVMKTFLDRMIPIMDPRMVRMENGRTGHFKRYERYPRLGVIATGGFPEKEFSDCVSRYFKRLARDLYSEVAFEIYRSQAALLKMDEGPLAPILKDYKAHVRRAGREVAEGGGVSPKTMEKLEAPLLPEDFYMEQANQYWESRMDRATKKNKAKKREKTGEKTGEPC
ncbi:Iron-sulfur protein [Candidatus Desulfarcum epimagneticum]|uniref:Iron-sulfur protein n=1 Tax=uncultured Desulfobacteraceae bacterium TaxID=218296 RepID=A0A484HLK7_9BACT|nr:Iron-sulfur protein [uncultured Desulfobacteraceae bacterium]